MRGEPKSIPLERDFEDRENYMKKIRELLKEMEEHRDKIRSRSEKYDSENLIAILNAENAMLWEMQRQLEARLENSESLNKKLAGDLYKEKHKILPPANVKSSVPIKDEVQLKMQRRLDLQADEIQSLKSTIEVLTDQKNQELKYYQQLVHNLKRQTSLAKS